MTIIGIDIMIDIIITVIIKICLRNDGTAVIADFGLAVRYRDENNSLDISPNTRLA